MRTTYKMISIKTQKMMKRWKIMGDLHKEGLYPQNTTEFSNMITEKLSIQKLRRTDNPNDLKEMIEALDAE